MNKGINILHHVGLIASNMSKLATCYEKLGFTLMPLSMPKAPVKPGAKPEMLGIGTRCAIFQNNYLELLGVVDQNRWSKTTKEQRGFYNIDEPLWRYEGLHVMHFGTNNIEATHARLINQGTPCSPIASFHQNVNSPDGKQQTMHAKNISFPQGSNPEALIQIAQHLTPELALPPRYMKHRNGAQSITEIIVCAEEPIKYIEKYERYTGHTCIQNGNLAIINLGYSRVIVVAPAFIDEIIPGCIPPLLPFLAGFTVSTEDLDVVRELLNTKQVSYLEHEERIIIPMVEACGSTVIFENSQPTRPCTDFPCA